MLKILLVDDDPLLTEMYAQKLKKDGYEVLRAANGEEGLQQLKQHKPNLVLLDIMMPKVNGLDVLKTIKADPDQQIQNTPVILLTNLARNMKDINFGLELGAVTYLVKSRVKPDQVVAKVKEVLEASGHDHILQPEGKTPAV